MFAVQEVLYGIAEDLNGNLLYTLDQLQSASLEVSSDPTEITDKNGNVIKQIYKSKTGTFTATSALLSPNIINAGSGSAIEKASAASKIEMPKVEIVGAGKPVDVSTALTGTVKVIGLYGNGANGDALDAATIAANTAGTTFTAPSNYVLVADSAGLNPGDPGYVTTYGTTVDPDAPIQYLVTYMREVEEGIKMANLANKFPGTVKLTLLVALADPCASEPKAAYVVIPSFQANPSMTISLDSGSSTVDFSGALQTSYCSCAKELYEILIPNEDIVIATAC